MKSVPMVALAFVTTLALFAGGCSGSDSDGGSTGPSRSGDGEKTTERESPGQNTNPTNPSNPTNPTKKANGAQCTKSADCESDFCVFNTGGSLGMCTKTCSDNIDCDLGERCVKLGDAPQKACVPE